MLGGLQAAALETVTLKAFFVGLTLNSLIHDYGVLQATLMLLKGRRVSKRVWLIAIENDVDGMIATLKGAVAQGDRIMIEAFPDSFDLQDWRGRPEFSGPLPLQLRLWPTPPS